MNKYMSLFALFFLSACGPYFYKYKDPKSLENHIPITINFTGDKVTPQVAYFLKGATCSDLRDLQTSTSIKKIYAPINEPASFHIIGIAYANASFNSQTATLNIKASGDRIITFVPHANSEYEIVFDVNNDRYRILLKETQQGKTKDITNLLVEREPIFSNSSTPSSSYWKDAN